MLDTATEPKPEVHTDPAARRELTVALVLTGLVTAPLLLGLGLDLPDDYLYYDVAGWEWLRHAMLSGKSPWFAPGKLGGVNLFGDVIAMGPFYPAGAWLALVLPVFVALPLAWLLHALATVFSVRWCARQFGISHMPATVAALALTVGPIGMMAIIDGRASGRPLWLWLPVALGALEALCRAERRADRARWAAAAGLAMALILLGSHIRVSAAVCACLGLWLIIRRVPLAWWPLMGGLALAGGSPGFVPMLSEWRQSATDMSRLDALAAPSEAMLNVWHLPGLISPVVDGFWENYGAGVVLLAATLLGAASLRGPVRRLLILAAVLVAAVLSLHVPGLRYLFAPLLLITHPVNTIYFGLAVFLLSLAGAAALDRLVPGETDQPAPLPRPALAVLAVLAGLAVLELALGGGLFQSGRIRASHAVGVVQAVLALGALLVLLRGALPPARRRRLIFLLAVVELGCTAGRFHLTVPSGQLRLWDRLQVREEEESLTDGYLDVAELMDTEGFLYQASVMKRRVAGEADTRVRRDWATASRDLQYNELDRYWPVHLGMARGYRGAAGRAKMPPARVVALLAPLQAALRKEDPQRGLLEADLWSEGGIGARVLSLMGARVAVDQDDTRHVRAVTPWCYTAPAARVVTDEGQRVAALLGSSPGDETRTALLETPLPGAAATIGATSSGASGGQAMVTCDVVGHVQVNATTPALVVIRERHHPGWQVMDENGRPLKTFPVNQIHTGVMVPAGEQTLTVTFTPPGLIASGLAAGLAWVLGLGILVLTRRRAATRTAPTFVAEIEP